LHPSELVLSAAVLQHIASRGPGPSRRLTRGGLIELSGAVALSRGKQGGALGTVAQREDVVRHTQIHARCSSGCSRGSATCHQQRRCCTRHPSGPVHRRLPTQPSPNVIRSLLDYGLVGNDVVHGLVAEPLPGKVSTGNP